MTGKVLTAVWVQFSNIFKHVFSESSSMLKNAKYCAEKSDIPPLSFQEALQKV